jgi:hypothetical protein
MAETAPTPTDRVPRHQQPQLPPSPRFRPFSGGLTMVMLAIGGLIIMSPDAATAPGQGPTLPRHPG